MTPQEEAMLNDLIGRVQQTQLTEKDPDAEQLLNQQLGRNPNALYILAQTVLVQKYALDQATAQIDQLRQQPVPAPARTTSFLGNLLGHREGAPPPPPPVPPPGYGESPYGQQPWNQVPSYGTPSYGPPPPQQGPSFLRSAATTAAGVAAGALAFEGVESLLHGFGHPSGFGGGGYFGGFGGSGGAPEEIITNNYYDEPGRGSSEAHHERADNSSYGDSSNDAANLQQASDDLRDDDTSVDDVSYDDSSFDDSGNNDDLA
jgi:hypothetical protein